MRQNQYGMVILHGEMAKISAVPPAVRTSAHARRP